MSLLPAAFNDTQAFDVPYIRHDKHNVTVFVPNRPYYAFEDNDDGDDDDKDNHEAYKRVARRSSAGLDGSLEMMKQLPVDIIYEIFSFLHPKDLLSMSRSSKTLHSILSETHARGVWRSSLASVRALPSCPQDMSEIQYASLAFDDWCHFCLASKVEDIAWVARVRCCTRCLKEHFISEDELDLWLPEDIYIENPDSIFPSFLSSQNRAPGRNKPMYYLPRAREYLEELDHLDGDDALATWAAEKKQKLEERIKHAAQCEYWHTHWAFRPAYGAGSSYVWELALVIWLSVLLLGLWKDQLVALTERF